MLINKEDLPDGFIIPDIKGHYVFAPMKETVDINEIINMALPGEKIPAYTIFTHKPGKITEEDIEWAMSCKNCNTECQFSEDTKNGLIKGGICPDWICENKDDLDTIKGIN